MEKIINPYDNNCIGCSPKNPIGLKMEFFYDKRRREVVSVWQPQENFQGYPNVLHGGIQTTMVDEIAAWSVYILLETAGVTKNLNVHFQHPVYLSKGNIILKASLASAEERTAKFNVQLLNADNKVCSVGLVEYFIYPEKIAIKKFGYPGLDAFFEKK